MPLHIRKISLLLRRRDSQRECRRILQAFEQYQAAQRQLAPARPESRRLLIIRLDDIGDYLLFRNQLECYKNSSRWKNHHITLLGNEAWKELFSRLDSAAVDSTVWVNKARYLQQAEYRLDVWRRLRAGGFDTVVAPSRTRPLLLDDACMLAAGPIATLACRNSYVHEEWNRLSDAMYAELFSASSSLVHEFVFNAEFAAWACGVSSSLQRPWIPSAEGPQLSGNYVVCFLGANTRSKRWPAKRWIQLIRRFRTRHSAEMVLAGSGPAEARMASLIQRRTGSQSIVGKVSLAEFLDWVRGAQAVLTNDTMAAHMAVSCNKPTVIIANGVNYMRFTEYGTLGVEDVRTVYPEVFTRHRQRRGDGPYEYSAAVSADIGSIPAKKVLAELNESWNDSRAVAGSLDDVHPVSVRE